MKRIFSIIIISVFAFTVLLASNSIFQSIVANSTAASVSLEWRTTDENSLSKFEIERAAQNMAFVKIGEETAKGYPSQYKYEDADAFMKILQTESEKYEAGIQSKNSYKYRVKAVYTNGSTILSEEVSVNHTVNSVRRTWGMIKEMFR